MEEAVASVAEVHATPSSQLTDGSSESWKDAQQSLYDYKELFPTSGNKLTGWNLFLRGMRAKGVMNVKAIKSHWWNLTPEQRAAINSKANAIAPQDTPLESESLPGDDDKSTRINCPMEGCESTFKTLALMKYHVKNKCRVAHPHGLKCPQCGKQMSHIRDFDLHQSRHARSLLWARPSSSGLEKSSTKLIVPEDSKAQRGNTYIPKFRATYPEENPDDESADLKTVYQCGECGEEAEGSESLKEHYMSQHDVDISLARAQEMQVHVPAVKADGPTLRYPCPACGRLMFNRENLASHMKKVHPNDGSEKEAENVQPVEIEKKVKPKRAKAMHVVCSMCGKKFLTQVSLHTHHHSFHKVIKPCLDKIDEALERIRTIQEKLSAENLQNVACTLHEQEYEQPTPTPVGNEDTATNRAVLEELFVDQPAAAPPTESSQQCKICGVALDNWRFLQLHYSHVHRIVVQPYSK